MPDSLEDIRTRQQDPLNLYELGVAAMEKSGSCYCESPPGTPGPSFHIGWRKCLARRIAEARHLQSLVES